jgi:5-formyltetrahydrofolate cyclo-ligase
MFRHVGGHAYRKMRGIGLRWFLLPCRRCVSADRSLLRRELRERRRAIPAVERIAAAESLARHLLELPFMPTSGLVAGYWAMDGEIALHVWQLRLPRPLVYCLPALGDDGRLRFAPWRPGEPLVSNRFGIPEPDVAPSSLVDPEHMALVVVPLVGFDHHGQRLGMGGGWYDRSFAFRNPGNPPPWLVGAGFAAQQVGVLPVQPWDVALDAVCSEQALLLISPDNRDQELPSA